MTNQVEFMTADGPVGPLQDLLASLHSVGHVQLLDAQLSDNGVAVLAMVHPSDANTPVRFLLGEVVPQQETILSFWNVVPFQPLVMVRPHGCRSVSPCFL